MSRRVQTALLSAAAVALAASVWLGVSRGFFSGDSGVKFAQAHALWESNFSSRALPYDWDLDPDGEFFPYGEFFREVDGERQGIYSVVFTGLAAPLIGLFGLAGTLVLPLAGGVLVLAGVHRALVRTGHPPWLALLAGGAASLATPVLFYAGQFAEHAPATGLVTFALALLVGAPAGRRPALAGALAGLAATLRPEAYCALVSLGLVALIGGQGPRQRLRHGASFAASAGAVLVAYWTLNLALSGHWDPLVALNTDDSASLDGTVTMLVGEVEGRSAVFWLLPFAIAVCAGAIPRSLLAGYPALIARVVLTLWIAYVCASALEAGVGRTQMGLFAVTPLAAYGLSAGAWTGRQRALWLFGVTFVGQVLFLDSSGTAGGLQFGARLVLPALPALVALSLATAWEDARSWRRPWSRGLIFVPIVGLVAITGYAMARGLPDANEIAEDGYAAAERVRAAPGDVVVTGRWWESQVLAAALLDGKPIYHARGGPRRLLGRLAEAGVERVVLVSGARADFTLSGGYSSRRVTLWTEWLDIQDVVLEARDSSSYGTR